MELAVPKVLAWKCPYTGELFEDEKKYKNHLAKLARYRREQRKLQIAEDAAQSWWTEFQNIEMDISELPKLIIENQDKFWAESNRTDRWNWQQIGQTRKGVIMPTPKLVKFTKFDLRWSDSVSNTHNCPKNGSTNWGGNRSDLPRGYPGRHRLPVRSPKTRDQTGARKYAGAAGPARPSRTAVLRAARRRDQRCYAASPAAEHLFRVRNVAKTCTNLRQNVGSGRLLR